MMPKTKIVTFFFYFGQIEIQKLPHPACEIMVPVTCIGGHETADWPCWNSKPTSCGRACRRRLKCGNHFCQEPCHIVADLNSKDVRCFYSWRSRIKAGGFKIEQADQNLLSFCPNFFLNFVSRPGKFFSGLNSTLKFQLKLLPEFELEKNRPYFHCF